jgi:hypothetical protein
MDTYTVRYLALMRGSYALPSACAFVGFVTDFSADFEAPTRIPPRPISARVKPRPRRPACRGENENLAEPRVGRKIKLREKKLEP